MTVFGSDYAALYDLVYKNKDYESECDQLEGVFNRYAASDVRRILDLGCGTGNHAIPFARRGYEVTGVDRSAEMLDLARSKARAAGVPLDLRRGDVRTVDLESRFDVVVLLFAVLGYQLADDDVKAALSVARGHLDPGGILVFDVWHGPAVLALKPERRVLESVIGDVRLTRVSAGTLLEDRPVCSVTITVSTNEKGQMLAQTDETHLVRYFFPEEIEGFLADSGFQLLRVGAFPDFDQDPDEDTWNVMYAAAAV